MEPASANTPKARRPMAPLPNCPATPTKPFVNHDVTANTEWALYPADIYSQIVEHLDYRGAIAFALSCRAIAFGTQIWWAMCNDNGKRQIENSQNASEQFHQSKQLKQHRFLLMTVEGISLARRQGVNCGPNMRQSIVDGLRKKTDIEERDQNTSTIWINLKTEFEKDKHNTKYVQLDKWANEAYQALCAIFDELGGGTTQFPKDYQSLDPRVKSLLVKYVIDTALSISDCVMALMIGRDKSDNWYGLLHLEDYIDLGEFDVIDVLTELSLREILTIPAIVTLLHEGAVWAKELYFAVIDHKKEFSVDSTMLEKFPYFKSGVKNFPLAAIKDVRFEFSFEFTFTDILQCELIQNGLKRRHATLTQLINLPDDVIYHLMFNGYIRDALKSGKLTLTDVVAQNDNYIKYRDEKHFYDRLRFH